MKRLIIAAALLAASLSSAQAAMVTTTACQKVGYHGFSCKTIHSEQDLGPRELRSAAEIEAFDQAWEKFCEPKSSAPDPITGMIHKLYKHKCCSSGCTQ
jgi:hypothetical protein